MRVVMLPSWYPTRESPYAGTFFRALARALAGIGHDVTVLFPELSSLRDWRPGSGLGRLVEESDGPVRELRWRGFRWWPRERHGTVAFTHAARRLTYEYISAYGSPDVVHAQVVLPAGYAAARLARLWEIPFVMSEHAGPFDMMRETAWQRRQVRLAFAEAAAVTAVSESLRSAMTAAGIEREIKVVPNTYDPTFDDGWAERKREVGQEPRFLAIASLRPAKGLEELLGAWSQVARQAPAARLTIAGEGPLRRELEALAARLGLGERIEFVGRLASPTAVRKAIIDSDVLVLPSHAESFGVVLIEALACGRPVVATRCGGPEGIVRPEDGLLVRPRDVDDLARGMRRMLDRLSDYDGRSIATSCRARFGPAGVAAQFTDVYRQAVERFGASRAAS